jgi:hypothetical protein
LTDLGKIKDARITEQDFQQTKLSPYRLSLIDMDIMLEIGKKLKFEDKATELPSLRPTEKEPLLEKD